MKKIIGTLLILSTSMIVLMGCDNKVDSDVADRLIKKAESAIELLNRHEYDELTLQFDEKMTDAFESQGWDQVEEIVEEGGQFIRFEKASVAEKNDIFTTVTIAKYEKNTRTFTISFNQEDEIIGLFLK